MAFHVSNTSLSDLGRFSISLHWCFCARMAFWWATSSRSAFKLLNLDNHDQPCQPIWSQDWVDLNLWMQSYLTGMDLWSVAGQERIMCFFPLWYHRFFSERSLHCDDCTLQMLVVYLIMCFFDLQYTGAELMSFISWQVFSAIFMVLSLAVFAERGISLIFWRISVVLKIRE